MQDLINHAENGIDTDVFLFFINPEYLKGILYIIGKKKCTFQKFRIEI